MHAFAQAHLETILSKAGLCADPLRSIVVQDVEVFVLAVEVVAEGLDVPVERWTARISDAAPARAPCTAMCTATYLKDARSSLIYVASP